MTAAASTDQSRQEKKRRYFGYFMLLLILLCFLCVMVFLAISLQLGPLSGVPVGLHSTLAADYSADPRGRSFEVANLSLISGMITATPGQWATLQDWLQTPVPAVTSNGAAPTLAKTATPTGFIATATFIIVPSMTPFHTFTPAATLLETPTLMVWTNTPRTNPTLAPTETSSQPTHPPAPTDTLPPPTAIPPTDKPPTNTPLPPTRTPPTYPYP